MLYTKKIKIVSFVIAFLFLVAIVFTASRSGLIIINEDNYNSVTDVKTTIAVDKKSYETVMGDILDRNYTTIMQNTVVMSDGPGEYHKSYSHLLGRIDMNYNGVLTRNYSDLTNKKADDIIEDKGYSISLTLNDSLQKFCYDNTEGKRCSVVVMDRDSGELLALTSTYKQDFDMGKTILGEGELKQYNTSSEPVWLPEYLNAYSPGSTMKIFSACVACENQLGDFTIDDVGYYECSDGTKLYNDSQVSFGNGLDLPTAFTVSSNSYFASLFKKLGVSKLRDASVKFMMNDQIKTDFGLVDGTFSFGNYTDLDIASLGYGQGESLMSSVSIAMMTQGALEGKIYRPHVIKSICYKDQDGFIVDKETTKEDVISSKVVSKKTSEIINELMKNNARSANYDLPDFVLGAKTGTADLPDGSNRAIIVGFDEEYIVVISRIEDNLYGRENRSLLIDIFDKINSVM